MSRILVVEDDTTLALATRRVLRGGGHEVQVASDAVTGVSAAREFRPDAVVLDVGLPAGGGVLVLQRLRMNQQTASVPVVVVTGGVATDKQATLERLGVTSILTKPVRPDALMAALAAVLPDAGTGAG